MLRRFLLLLLAPVLLVGCAADTRFDAIEDVQRAAYTAPGGPKLTLITAISNNTGVGGHSALMISGAQRVMFDPAGTWWHPTVPERGDVLYGMTPLMLEFYTDYHARETYHVVFQEIDLTPEIAAKAIALVEAHGPAPKAHCGQSVSGVLQSLGFSGIRRAWYPDKIMEDFAQLPDVRENKVFDDSPDENEDILAAQKAALVEQALAN